MKVAFDHQIFAWQRYGGVSRYFFELANNLAEIGEDRVQVRINSPFYVNDYLRQAKPPLQVTGLRAPAIRRTGRAYRAVNELLAPMLLRRWAPDILHETYYSPSTVAPAKSRIVLTVFDMIHELFPEHFPSWDPTRREKQMAVKRADHIICISENTRQDLIRVLGVEPEKTTVVHLGFALTSSDLAPISPARKPYLLFVGSRGGYKNFSNFLEAYASSQDLREALDLVAFGGGDFSSKEQSLMRHYGLNELQVRQISGGDEVLGALYKSAALFVYPSLYEGFGIPPLEAMSFDCLVACSNTSSIPEVVGDAAVLFDPHSVESISAALQAVLNNEELRSRLRAKGRERVRAFSWRTCAEQTLDVYRKVLS